MAQEERFKKIIFSYAENVKGSRLTNEEKNEVIDYFNESKQSGSLGRVKEAIEKTFNREIYEILLEKSASSLDNIDDLLSQLTVEADKWDNK
ncbi:hypothetical protein [Sporosarcina sp. SG10008]|uniref:hypothetical protein n=1 Tax=Sporosarcina sp. SG10008 TaxID=3373103 RepID=UPI0037DD0E72